MFHFHSPRYSCGRFSKQGGGFSAKRIHPIYGFGYDGGMGLLRCWTGNTFDQHLLRVFVPTKLKMPRNSQPFLSFRPLTRNRFEETGNTWAVLLRVFGSFLSTGGA